VSIWSRLIGRKKPGTPAERNSSVGETAAGPASGTGDVAPKTLEVAASVRTDVGCVRESNEDNATFTRPQDVQTLATKGVLALVADGMGGCSGGEIASAMAINSVPRTYYASELQPHEALKEAFEKVNQEIFAAAASDPELAGMGTTGVALAISGNQAYAAYVGDSRLYLIRAGRIYLMTQDHSVVNDMVCKGLLTPEEARNHEDRNVLFRSLGGRPEVEVSTWDAPLELRGDDRFLLCSDGLHDLVEDSEILATVLSQDNDSSPLNLIQMAKNRGGYDNVTVALIHVHSGNGLPAADAKATREIRIPS
jgi:serine/threonine protein phosphatase PrpC